MIKKLVILGLVLLSLSLMVWWLKPATEQSVVVVKQPPTTAAPQIVASPIQPPATPISAAQMTQQQNQAAQIVAKQPLIEPIVGTVQQRPAFVSEMEWGMLQAAAQQSPQPSIELNRLVNTLRFRKMLETWQTQQQHSPALAAQLLQELPVQFKQGQLAEDEVRQLQEQLIAVAESNPAARDARLQHERQRLHDIKQS